MTRRIPGEERDRRVRTKSGWHPAGARWAWAGIVQVDLFDNVPHCQRPSLQKHQIVAKWAPVKK